MDSGDGAARIDEEQILALAEKLLASGDFAGSKNLAHTLISNPLLTNCAEQVIAVADALLSSKLLVNNQVNSYAVLQLDPSSCDASTIHAHYTRLTRRLLAARDRLPSAAEALRVVSNAWEVLSDPDKKSLLDAQKEEDASLTTFLTSCDSCCNVFQYERAFIGCRLRCRTCRLVFTAAELPAPPPIVPGTDMYYSSWIAAPVGYVTGNTGSGFNPFYTMRPQASTCTAAAAAAAAAATGCGGGGQTSTPPTKMPPAKTEAVVKKSGGNFKVRARKTVRANLKKTAVSGEAGSSLGAKVEDCAGMEANPLVIDSEEED